MIIIEYADKGKAMLLFVELENREEGLGRDGHGAELAHLFLAFLLLFQKLLFSCDVAAVAFGQYVLAHGAHGLAGNDLAADGRLNGHLKELARDVLLQLFAELAGAGVGLSRWAIKLRASTWSPFRSMSTFTRSESLYSESS